MIDLDGLSMAELEMLQERIHERLKLMDIWVGFQRYTGKGQGMKCYALVRIHVKVTPNLVGRIQIG